MHCRHLRQDTDIKLSYEQENQLFNYFEFIVKHNKELDLTRITNFDDIIVKHVYATRGLIDKVHELGKQLHVWTVNDPETIESLIERGVDGIISDYPNLLFKYK